MPSPSSVVQPFPTRVAPPAVPLSLASLVVRCVDRDDGRGWFTAGVGRRRFFGNPHHWPQVTRSSVLCSNFRLGG